MINGLFAIVSGEFSLLFAIVNGLFADYTTQTYRDCNKPL